MNKEAFDPGAFNGAAYGTAIGGGIGAYSSTVSFPNKLNKKQKLALILAGALAGASSGASIGSTPMRRKVAADKSVEELLALAKILVKKNRVRALESIRGVDHKAQLETTKRVHQLMKSLKGIEADAIKTASFDKTALTVTPELHGKLLDKIVTQPRKPHIEQELHDILMSENIDRLNNARLRTIAREQLNPVTFDPDKLAPVEQGYINMAGETKTLPYANKGLMGRLRQAARITRGIKAAPVEATIYASTHPLQSAVIGAAGVVPGVIAGASKKTFNVGKSLYKYLNPPTKTEQLIAKLGPIKNKAIALGLLGGTVAAGTYVGNKTAAFKFNPSILGESVDDVMDVYIMYKAQKKQVEKERAAAAYNSRQKDK